MCVRLAECRYPGLISPHSGVSYIEFNVSPSRLWGLIPDMTTGCSVFVSKLFYMRSLYSCLALRPRAVHQTWILKRIRRGLLSIYTDGLCLDCVLLMSICCFRQQTVRPMDRCRRKIAAGIYTGSWLFVAVRKHNHILCWPVLTFILTLCFNSPVIY